MRSTLGLCLALVCLIVTTACDSEDEPPPLMGQEAVAACEDIVNELCGLAMRCGSTLSLDECRADFGTAGFLCDRAVSADADYGDCFDRIHDLPCTSTQAPDECRSIVQIGPERPVPVALTSCFVPTVESCDAHCASLGKSCEQTCQIWPDIPVGLAGIGWEEGGVCPTSEEGLAIPSCSSPLGIHGEVRCCCSQ
jgi:hypothetical protein